MIEDINPMVAPEIQQKNPISPPTEPTEKPEESVNFEKDARKYKAVSTVFIIITLILAVILTALLANIYLVKQNSKETEIDFKTAATYALPYARIWSHNAQLYYVEGIEYSSSNYTSGLNVIVQADRNIGDGKCNYWYFEYYSPTQSDTFLVELYNCTAFFTSVSSTGNPGVNPINVSSTIDSTTAAVTAQSNGGADFIKANSQVDIAYNLKRDTTTLNLEWQVYYMGNNSINTLSIYIDAAIGNYMYKYPNPTQTPTGTFTNVTKISQNQEMIAMGGLTPSITWGMCTLEIENMTATGNTVNDYNLIYQTGGNVNCTLSGAQGIKGMLVSGTDMADDNLISYGDYFTITMIGSGFAPGSYFMVSLNYILTGSTICTKSFFV